jgi:serine/threonine protein phosphatase PrpC
MSRTGQHGEVAAPWAGRVVSHAATAVPWAVAGDPDPSSRFGEDRWGVDEARSLFAVADGMGGHHAGGVAAEIAVRTVLQGHAALLDAGLAPADALRRAVESAQAGIVEFARTHPDCLGMATTLVAAVMDRDRLLVAHVGDSRAYRYRAGTLTRLTRDHSVGQRMVDAGHFDEDSARCTSVRGILTRVLGIDAEPPQVEVHAHAWSDGDLLLLCTDGLTDALDDAALAALMALPAEGHAARARSLLAMALAEGGDDDVTVLLAGRDAVAH